MIEYDNLRERLCESPLHSDGRVNAKTTDILYEAARAITDLDAKVMYTERTIDQLTQDLANAQAEIDRLRDALDYIANYFGDNPRLINEDALILTTYANKALSQSSTSLALQEYKKFEFDNNKIRAIVMENRTKDSNICQIIDATINAIRNELSASPTNTKG